METNLVLIPTNEMQVVGGRVTSSADGRYGIESPSGTILGVTADNLIFLSTDGARAHLRNRLRACVKHVQLLKAEIKCMELSLEDAEAVAAFIASADAVSEVFNSEPKARSVHIEMMRDSDD